MDTLRAVNELMTEGHFDREQSEVLARVMQGLWTSEMATKSDIAGLRAEMATKHDIAAVRTEMAGMHTEIAATKNDITGLRGDIKLLRSDISMIESRLSNKLYGLALTVVIAMGVIQGVFQHYLK